jgi:hypothetical protein
MQEGLVCLVLFSNLIPFFIEKELPQNKKILLLER